MYIVLSFAPSAAAVGHCDRVRIMCESDPVRHSVSFKHLAEQFVFEYLGTVLPRQLFVFGLQLYPPVMSPSSVLSIYIQIYIHICSIAFHLLPLRPL